MRAEAHASALPREILLATVILLLALSTVMVFSAGAFYHSFRDPFHLLKRELLWLPLAFLVACLFATTDYRVYRRTYILILLGSVALLVAVLIPGVGRTVNRSQRWLPLGGGLQFQPSELAKLAVTIFVAGFLSNRPERARQFWKGFVPLSLALLAVFGLILEEPDLGTSLFVFALGCGVMLVAGMRPWFLLVPVLPVAPVLALYVRSHWETVSTRLEGMLDPTGLHQVWMSFLALGSGGWSGVGLGAGVQKLRYLPEAHTDFILAVIGEELGFVGTAVVVLLFVSLTWAAGAIAWRARDRFGFLVGSGIAISLGFQAAINVAVVTGSAPTKGIPLPFLSFGGSGLCMTLASVGVLVSIARGSEREACPVLEPGGGSRAAGKLVAESPAGSDGGRGAPVEEPAAEGEEDVS